MSEDFVPWSERNDDDSVDDLLGLLAGALEEPSSSLDDFGENMVQHDDPAQIVNDLVSNVFEARNEIGVIGHFIFAGEVIGEDGVAHMMVVTSDNLPDWVARGMIMTADDHIAMGGGSGDGGR